MERDFQHQWTPPLVPGRTHVPYQTAYVDTRGNDNTFARRITGILCQIILAAAKLGDEIDQFIETQPWTDVAPTTQVQLPYNKQDFASIIHNYFLAFKNASKIIGKQRKNRLELEPWLCCPSGTQVAPATIKDLLSLATQSIESLRRREEEMMESLDINEWDLDKIINKRKHLVPAVSPQEIRFWISLNTNDFHNKIQEELVKGLQNFKEFWSNTQKIVEGGRDGPAIPQFPKVLDSDGRSDTEDAKAIGMFTPNVFFFCSGIRKQGKKVHDVVTIGATQEQLRSWPTLWHLRRDARRNHLGPSPQTWFDFYQNLSTIESRLGPEDEEVLLRFREELVAWRLKVSSHLPAALTTQDRADIPVLRSCQQHIGQAYRHVTGSFEPIGCCYTCKLSIGYQEAKTVDIPFVARDFKMSKRSNLPWSCAEVASSMYCDEASGWYYAYHPQPEDDEEEAPDDRGSAKEALGEEEELASVPEVN